MMVRVKVMFGSKNIISIFILASKHTHGIESHEPFSLYHHNVLILFNCFFVMIHCISKEAAMRAKQFCILTTTESRAKV